VGKVGGRRVASRRPRRRFGFRTGGR
jgi:hypothetical protein